MTRFADRIRVKRVYEPATADDGARVLVDRLWPRGLRREAAGLALWLKDAAPSPQLRKWFGRDPSRWQEFASRYQAELQGNPGPVQQLQQLASQGPVTLLYAARDEVHNHARVLADHLRSRLRG